MLDHLRLLLAWTPAINLTAIREPTAAVTRHILDSLAAVRPLRDRGVDAFLDLGSGGGHPGLPLALALPAVEAVLVESVAKKVAFLRVAIEAAATGVPTPGSSGDRGPRDRAPAIRVVAARAEALAADRAERERWPAVTARAVGSLADLAELAFPLLRPRGVLIAWKRGDPGDEPLRGELAAGAAAVAALGGGSIELVDAGVPGLDGHRLVVVTKRRPTPPDYPRDPAARRRRPWA